MTTSYSIIVALLIEDYECLEGAYNYIYGLWLISTKGHWFTQHISYIPVHKRIKALRWDITTSLSSYTPVAIFDLVIIPQKTLSRMAVSIGPEE